MRIAAGILMIIYSVRTIVFVGGTLSVQGFGTYPLVMSLAAIISAVFIITGGVFCLKRKYWKLCFASSLVLLLFLMFELVFIYPFAFGFSIVNLPQNVYMAISLPWGILPLIFVCLRKSEWQEISA